jgi:hypothetical protein
MQVLRHLEFVKFLNHTEKTHTPCDMHVLCQINLRCDSMCAQLCFQTTKAVFQQSHACLNVCEMCCVSACAILVCECVCVHVPMCVQVSMCALRCFMNLQVCAICTSMLQMRNEAGLSDETFRPNTFGMCTCEWPMH